MLCWGENPAEGYLSERTRRSWLARVLLRVSGITNEPGDTLKQRIMHGSDYPFPPARLPYLFRTGLFPEGRSNSLDLDLRIK